MLLEVAALLLVDEDEVEVIPHVKLVVDVAVRRREVLRNNKTVTKETKNEADAACADSDMEDTVNVDQFLANFAVMAVTMSTDSASTS